MIMKGHFQDYKRTSKYRRSKLVVLKEELDKSTDIAGDINTLSQQEYRRKSGRKYKI